MTMAVHVEKQIASRCPAHQQGLHCEYSLVLLLCGSAVLAVQIEAERVRPRVTPCHTIGIEHRDDLEDEAAAKLRGPWVVGEDELEVTVGGKLPRRLSRVHPSGKEADWTAWKPQRRRCRRCYFLALQRIRHRRRYVLARPVLPCEHVLGDCQQLHTAAHGSERHGLPVEVNARAGTWYIAMAITGLKIVQLLWRLTVLTKLVLGGRCGWRGRCIEIWFLVSGHQIPLLQKFLLDLTMSRCPRLPVHPSRGSHWAPDEVSRETIQPSHHLGVAVGVTKCELRHPGLAAEAMLPNTVPTKILGGPHVDVCFGGEPFPTNLLRRLHEWAIARGKEIALL
mmetsp:Transcript_129722/g.276782  ORF Transcript_129722/g.276782 Transcript_129722/m.276782 type:complete len:337 (-) Transcript_129722:345-1355(-)